MRRKQLMEFMDVPRKSVTCSKDKLKKVTKYGKAIKFRPFSAGTGNKNEQRRDITNVERNVVQKFNR